MVKMKNRITKNLIYKHTDGSILEGFRVIEGTTKIRQIIVYQEQYIADSATYSEGQEAEMDAMGQQIMFEFATGRTLSAKTYSENVKF